MAPRAERLTVSGTSGESDEERQVSTNAWLVGDDDEVIVIDPAGDAEAVLEAVADRGILAVVCTHAHATHSSAAPGVAGTEDVPVALHPADGLIWDTVHGDRAPEIDVEDGGLFEVAGVELRVLHTPGHSPGSVCLYAEELGLVLSGDTLLAGGPGPTDLPYADYPRLLTSIGEKLLTLPRDTRVLPGHGDETTVGRQDRDFDSWVSAGP